MIPLERAIHRLQGLPVGVQQQAIDFIEFLSVKYTDRPYTPSPADRATPESSRPEFQDCALVVLAGDPGRHGDRHSDRHGDRYDRSPSGPVSIGHGSPENGSGQTTNTSPSCFLDLPELGVRRSVYELVERALPRFTGHMAPAIDLYKAYARSNPALLLDRESFHEILVELASPLVGYLGRETSSDWEHERFWIDRGWPKC